MPLAFLTFQLLAPNGHQRRQTVKAQKGHDTAAFPRCGAFAIPTNAPRRWRCATCFETHCATTKCSPYPTDGQVGRVDFRRLLRSRFAGLGNRAQVATCSWLRGSGGSSVQSSSAVSDGCSPSSSLSVKSTSVSPICDHGRAMQAGRARCTKAASGRAYDTIVAIRGWRPEDWSSGPGRRRAAQGLCGRSTNGAR